MKVYIALYSKINQPTEHASPALTEADRLMTICNSCRYCEGLCAVYPAMEMRRTFLDGDLNYLANLCHDCGACFIDCQFAPPHEFNVNVPKTFATVRSDTYQTYTWPSFLAPFFERNGLFVGVFSAFSVAIFIIIFVALKDMSALWSVQTGPNAFYRLMPHNLMVIIFGSVSVYVLLAIGMSIRKFWRDIDKNNKQIIKSDNLWRSIKDASTLRYLDGGGSGCYSGDNTNNDNRRLYHHFTFYGFILCFISTSVATFYHYFLNIVAPYEWYDLPVLIGTIGGIGLIVGPIGLLKSKLNRDLETQDKTRFGMDLAFLVMLFLTSFTGLILMFLRSSPAMGLLLAIHLGVVFSLFITIPYSKFMHGIYRFLALVRYAQERSKL